MKRIKGGSLVRYEPSATAIVVGLALIGLLVYFLLRNPQSTSEYKNLESWDVQYNVDGLPTKITIHRDAVKK